jgi:uncharacterized protein YjbI with pentapeptide repeats
MKNCKYIITFLFILFSNFCFSAGNETSAGKKILIVNFKKLSGNRDYDFFKVSLSRSIKISMSRKLNVSLGNELPDLKRLQKLGYTNYISGNFSVTGNEIRVLFSIYSSKSARELVRVKAVGYADPRIFAIIDTVSLLASNIIVKPPVGTIFTTVTFNIEKTGKVKMKSVKLTKAQLRKIIKFMDLKGANLEKLDLSMVDMEGVNLTGAILKGVKFQNSVLRNSNLKNTDLKNAILRGADLRGADLSGADLRDADLRGADLRGAKLTGAKLQGAIFQEADLSFSAADNEANIDGANFRKSYVFASGLNKEKLMKLTNNDIWIEPKFLLGINVSAGMSSHITRINSENYTLKIKPGFSLAVSISGIYFFEEHFGLLLDFGWETLRTKEVILEGYNVVTGTSYPPEETTDIKFQNLIFSLAPIFRIRRIVYLYAGVYGGVVLKHFRDTGEYIKRNAVFGICSGVSYRIKMTSKIYLLAGVDFKIQLTKWGKDVILKTSKIFGVYGKVGLMFGVK